MAITKLYKNFLLGITKQNTILKERCKIYIEIELREEKRLIKDWELKNEYNKILTLSIVGDVVNRGKSIIFGQINDTIKKLLENDGFCCLFLKKEDIMKLLEIWKEYHLNDLIPGTKRQMEILKKYGIVDYETAVEILKQHNLYIDNGYKYGSGWLYKPIPNEVIEFLKDLPEL